MRDWLRDHSLYHHVVAPIWTRIPEKARWRIVSLLDQSKRQCWADLVSDALARSEKDPCDTYVPRLAGERAPRCATTCDWGHQDHTGEHDCSCYCGKFRFLATEGSRDRAAAE